MVKWKSDEMECEKETISLGRYRHFKGNEYEVIALAKHSETGEPMVVYRALYGDGQVWVRPAYMWNETVVRDGKTYKRFYRMDRIERVERYEQLYDEVLQEVERRDGGTGEATDDHSYAGGSEGQECAGTGVASEEQLSFDEKVQLLKEYYDSGQWLEDYTADENGEFPPDMKRGVLSQDGLYDLLEEAEQSGV